MPDRCWPEPANLSTFRLDHAGLRVNTIDPGPMTQVAGNLAAALAHAGLDKAHGWPEEAQGGTYAVRTGVDRALLVGVSLPDGWHGQFGATAASDALSTFVLSGEALPRALSRLGEIALSQPSAATSFLTMGFRTILYRHGSDLRLHVSRPLADAFAGQLTAVFADLVR